MKNSSNEMSSPEPMGMPEPGPVEPSPEPSQPGGAPSAPDQEPQLSGLDKHRKGLEEFKAKHNKSMEQKKEKSVFKGGVVEHSQSIEKRALKAYREATGKSFREVEANKDKILTELGIKGKGWHRKNKIEREIAAAKKRMPYMKSWERKRLRQMLEAKTKTFGFKSAKAKKKRRWF